ncbi:hypothetical protein KW837_12290 [Pseudomonas sp. PDM24]|nr:hypothetical protein [Pseudomonas sp. PDM24]
MAQPLDELARPIGAYINMNIDHRARTKGIHIPVLGLDHHLVFVKSQDGLLNDLGLDSLVIALRISGQVQK